MDSLENELRMNLLVYLTKEVQVKADTIITFVKQSKELVNTEIDNYTKLLQLKTKLDNLPAELKTQENFLKQTLVLDDLLKRSVSRTAMKLAFAFQEKESDNAQSSSDSSHQKIQTAWDPSSDVIRLNVAQKELQSFKGSSQKISEILKAKRDKYEHKLREKIEKLVKNIKILRKCWSNGRKVLNLKDKKSVEATQTACDDYFGNASNLLSS